MKTAFGVSLCLLGTLAAGPLSAQLTEYAFDTVTSLEMDDDFPTIIGTEKQTGAPLTVTFRDMTNIEFRYVVNRCVPVFLTMIEKPGRYYLYVSVNPADLNVQLKSCRLEVKL